MAADYHIHTRLCGHAEGEPREYVEQAIRLGLSEMGFADHLPLPEGWRPGYGVSADGLTMSRDDLETYVSIVGQLQREYRGEMRILLGAEADYLEEALEWTAAVIEEYAFDYVIGSVHFIGDAFAYDHPALHDSLFEYGIDRVFLESVELAGRAAASGLFSVIGHLDLAKKFGQRPRDAAAVAAAASSALRALAAAGVALELNTAGWRRPAAEAYPAPVLLAEAHALGIPLTFGSDAHTPADVGHQFPRAVEMARAAGYEQTLRLSGGLEELP